MRQGAYALNAVDTAAELVLAQLPIQNKDCEITRIPELLKLLDIRGSVITTDAIGTQTSVMEQIREQGGHFLMMVKKNQPMSYEEITRLFQTPGEEKEKLRKDQTYRTPFPELMEHYDEKVTCERNRDRYEYRKYQACSHPDGIGKTQREWPFVKSAGCSGQTRILIVKDTGKAHLGR